MGESAAQTLRLQEGLEVKPINNNRLATLAGTSARAITQTTKCSEGLSFVFRSEHSGVRIALKSAWEANRRFNLARLTGDQLFNGAIDDITEGLSPATQTYSYRQKAQRAFAAELLSPSVAVVDMLGGDYADEDKQTEVAEYFKVSPMTIQSLLVNHKLIPHEVVASLF